MGDLFIVASFALAATTAILAGVVWRKAVAAASERATLMATIESLSTRTHHETAEARAEVKAVREAAAAATRRFQLMADNVPVLIWISGTDKGCTWCNRPWLDFTGRSLEMELGDGWRDNVHPDDRRRCIDTYGAAFDARVPITMEYRLRRHDDDYRWMLSNGVPLHDERGDFIGY